jgi:flagellar protein FliO/FliZ
VTRGPTNSVANGCQIEAFGADFSTRRAAPPIAVLIAVMFAACSPAFAQVAHPGGGMIGGLFLTSPAPISSGAAVSTSSSPSLASASAGAPTRPEARGPAEGSRPAGPAWFGRLSRKSQATGPEGWWLGMAGMALVVAICGAIGVAVRRFSPRAAHGAVQVVGRVSLSPRHTVYLLRAGQRVLLIGAGPQGAPALLGELEDLPEVSPSSEAGGEP